jgi:hypothetical protein
LRKSGRSTFTPQRRNSGIADGPNEKEVNCLTA